MDRLEELRELKEMLEQGLITEEEFEASKAKVLNESHRPTLTPTQQRMRYLLDGTPVDENVRRENIKRQRTMAKLWKGSFYFFLAAFCIATIFLLSLYFYSDGFLNLWSDTLKHLLLLGLVVVVFYVIQKYQNNVLAQMESEDK